MHGRGERCHRENYDSMLPFLSSPAAISTAVWEDFVTNLRGDCPRKRTRRVKGGQFYVSYIIYSSLLLLPWGQSLSKNFSLAFPSSPHSPPHQAFASLPVIHSSPKLHPFSSLPPPSSPCALSSLTLILWATRRVTTHHLPQLWRIPRKQQSTCCFRDITRHTRKEHGSYLF